MTNASTAATPAGPGNYEWLTTANLIVIAIFAILVIVAILWGARLKSRRKAAESELREDATTVSGDQRVDEAAVAGSASVTPVATLGLSDRPPADPEPTRAPPPSIEALEATTRDHQSEPVVTSAPPVAPSPPPLADTPVVATAPYDAAPATVAADLATPPDVAAVSDGDDLTRLKGVGPKLATRLAELGITRFDHIAALTPSAADDLDAQLGTFRGRLARDRWIEQAGYLARDDRAGFEAAFGKL